MKEYDERCTGCFFRSTKDEVMLYVVIGAGILSVAGICHTCDVMDDPFGSYLGCIFRAFIRPR